MIYIESDSKDPYFNLAMEEYVFNNLSRDEEYFILWQNENTVVVGKYQNTAQEINQDFIDANKIKVVRRLSGGGAVYHDKGNLNFTFIVDQKKNFDFDFKRFAMPVVSALKEMGINAEFTGRNDLTAYGKKFSGNSQYIRQNRIMHHGCIMVDSNLINVSDALRPKEAKFESKSARSVRSRVTTISDAAGRHVSVEEFKKILVRKIFGDKEISCYRFSPEEIKDIKQAAESKYATWEWNYGKSGNYNYFNSCKYDFGFVEVRAAIREGIIEEVRLNGDFFGNGEITDVENALKGLRVDERLSEKLEKIVDIGSYIRGMSAHDMQRLLR